MIYNLAGIGFNPGKANLLIGGFRSANREIGAPRFHHLCPWSKSRKKCGLGLRRLRRKISGFLLVLKSCGLVRPIAKGFACRMAAAAKRNRSAAGKTVRLALHIDKFDFPFDAQGPVIANCDLCRWHLCSRMPGSPSRTCQGFRVKASPEFFS